MCTEVNDDDDDDFYDAVDDDDGKFSFKSTLFASESSAGSPKSVHSRALRT